MIARRRLFAILVVCCALLWTGGCGATKGRELVWQDPAYQLVWPSPPDPARVRYLRAITGPEDFRKEDRSGKLFRWLLGDVEDELPLLTPFAVATDGSGIVWVADSGSRMLYRIDLSKDEIDYIQEVAGVRLTSPSGVAVDGDRGRIYLADAALDHVLVLNQKGRYVGKLSPPQGFMRPAGIAVDQSSGRVYVTDVLAGTVATFDAEGRFAAALGSKAEPSGRFNRPLSVALGPAGEVLVVDSMNFRIEVQSARGELLGTIGRPGDAPGMFARPKGIAVDRHGHAFVSDAAFDNIQVFDLAGNLLMHFGNAGSGPGQFNLPAGLFFDQDGRLFVADSYNHRVQVFATLGPDR